MTLANLITIVRIALIPVFCLFAFDLETTATYKSSAAASHNLLIAGIIFCLASCTDYVDGYLARTMNQETSAGKLLDPLADKLLVTAALISLIEWRLVEGWTVFVMLAREFIITALRSFLTESGTKAFGASLLAKWKTFTQMAAIILFCFGFEVAGEPVYYISLILALTSGFEYIWKSRSYIAFK